MRNQPCPKPDCMYLHDLGDQEASFTKEEMHQGKHQEYERKLVQSLHASAPTAPNRYKIYYSLRAYFLLSNIFANLYQRNITGNLRYHPQWAIIPFGRMA